MNREDIIRMAHEVFDVQTDSRGRTTFSGDSYAIERFAEIVRKDYSTTHANLWLDRVHKFMLEEREACAFDAEWCIQNHLEHHIPERIRARGNT